MINFIPNPSFEREDSTPFWSSVNSSLQRFKYVKTEFGTWAARITATGAGTCRLEQITDFAVVEGRQHNFGAYWLPGNVGNAHLNIEWRDADHVVISTDQSESFNEEGHHFLTAVAPDEAEYAQISLEFDAAGSGDKLEVDAICFYEGENVGYFDGDYNGTWIAAPHLSMSIYKPDVGEQLYQMFESLVEHYGDNGDLKIMNRAIGSMFKELFWLIRDEDGHPGYSQLFDLNRTRPEWMRWLGQFSGYIPPTMPADWEVERIRISTRSAHRRGGIDILHEVVQEHLSDPKTVIIRERVNGDVAVINVYVYDDQITTSQAAVTEAALSQKAAGKHLNMFFLTGGTWDDLVANSTDWDTVVSKFADWNEVVADPDKP